MFNRFIQLGVFQTISVVTASLAVVLLVFLAYLVHNNMGNAGEQMFFFLFSIACLTIFGLTGILGIGERRPSVQKQSG